MRRACRTRAGRARRCPRAVGRCRRSRAAPRPPRQDARGCPRRSANTCAWCTGPGPAAGTRRAAARRACGHHTRASLDSSFCFLPYFFLFGGEGKARSRDRVRRRNARCVDRRLEVRALPLAYTCTSRRDSQAHARAAVCVFEVLDAKGPEDSMSEFCLSVAWTAGGTGLAHVEEERLRQRSVNRKPPFGYSRQRRWPRVAARDLGLGRRQVRREPRKRTQTRPQNQIKALFQKGGTLTLSLSVSLEEIKIAASRRMRMANDLRAPATLRTSTAASRYRITSFLRTSKEFSLYVFN